MPSQWKSVTEREAEALTRAAAQGLALKRRTVNADGSISIELEEMREHALREHVGTRAASGRALALQAQVDFAVKRAELQVRLASQLARLDRALNSIR